MTQVTSNKMLRARQNGKVSVSPPEGNELGAGFASTIGKFDVLVDTLSDEGKVGESMCIGINNDWDDFSTNDGEKCSSAVILALKTQHNCDRYDDIESSWYHLCTYNILSNLTLHDMTTDISLLCAKPNRWFAIMD